MTEAASAEAPAAGGTKRPGLLRRLLARVPTSVLVTLLGIVLTAWLLPAITKQWDDRQKAQEVRAGMVGAMASATAHALTGGEAIWSRQKVDATKVRDDWAVDSLEIETRLRAYFDPDLIPAWEIYSWLINRFDGGHTGQAEGALLSATFAPLHLDVGVAKELARVFDVGDREARGGPTFSASPNLRLEGDALAKVRGYLQPYLKLYEAGQAPPAPGQAPTGAMYGPHTAEFALLRLQAELAREVLQSRVRGYSTTTHDLVHDLLP